jgi:ribonuclease VapC
VNVLDASGAIAYVQREPGHAIVGPILQDAVISTVNWTEVIEKCGSRGLARADVQALLLAAGLAVVDFTREQAEAAADLYPLTRGLGLSLGDRACLALGRLRGAAVYTADRRWLEAALGIEIIAIR